MLLSDTSGWFTRPLWRPSRRFYCTRTNASQPVYPASWYSDSPLFNTLTPDRTVLRLRSRMFLLHRVMETKKKKKGREKGEEKEEGRTFIVGIELCRHGKSFIDTRARDISRQIPTSWQIRSVTRLVIRRYFCIRMKRVCYFYIYIYIYTFG